MCYTVYGLLLRSRFSFLENEENAQIAEFWKGLGMNELQSPSFDWTKPEWKAVENTTYQVSPNSFNSLMLTLTGKVSQ